MRVLTDRVAVVTGAGSGIGLAVAAALHDAGAMVVMGDIDSERVMAAAASIGSEDRVVPFELDVADPDSVEAIGDEAVARFGQLHIAVNNAGIVNGGRSWELGLDEWRAVLDVNLWGVIHGIRSFVPRILASESEGHVVNLCSTASLVAINEVGPYTAAKRGVLGITDVLRGELQAAGAPIGVSAVFPGLINTGMCPVGEDPAVAAAAILDGIRDDRPYVFTDDNFATEVQAQLHDLLAARTESLA
jgi:NAD(P)-dependent dehydrogenase (short-subunit alcohol dehydrogenase family)